MNDLKRCPFCGSAAQLLIVPGHVAHWVVKCTKGCCNTCQHISDHDAEEAWNKRTSEGKECSEVGMGERMPRRKVEFVESYWTGGELGSDYQWSDNHGELIRCMDCVHWIPGTITDKDDFIHHRCERNSGWWDSDDYCSGAERKDNA